MPSGSLNLLPDTVAVPRHGRTVPARPESKILERTRIAERQEGFNDGEIWRLGHFPTSGEVFGSSCLGFSRTHLTEPDIDASGLDAAGWEPALLPSKVNCTVTPSIRTPIFFHWGSAGPLSPVGHGALPNEVLRVTKNFRAMWFTGTVLRTGPVQIPKGRDRALYCSLLILIFRFRIFKYPASRRRM
jgi:hypothetical protein